MSPLPTLRLAFLRHFEAWPDVQARALSLLGGHSIAIPVELGPEEAAVATEFLSLLLDRPPEAYANFPDLLAAQMRDENRNALRLLLVHDTVGVDGEDRSTELDLGTHSVLLYSVKRAPEDPVLAFPHEFIVLRDLLAECLGRQLSNRPTMVVASWLALGCDSPRTALVFADAALTHALVHTDCSPGQWFAAGLAATVANLLRGIDDHIAEWALAYSIGGRLPTGLVSSSALQYGQDEALRRGFDLGLFDALDTDQTSSIRRLVPRRPLRSLSMKESPESIRLTDVESFLAPLLTLPQRLVLQRAGQENSPLPGFDGPQVTLPGPGGAKSSLFLRVSQVAAVQRIANLLEPTNASTIKTCILSGSQGTGKTMVAALVTKLLAHIYQPLWLRLGSDPAAEWRKLARAMGLGATNTNDMSAESDTPRWFELVKERLRKSPYLIILDDLESTPIRRLLRWQPPIGLGRCAVLMISAAPLPLIVRERDAIVIDLGESESPGLLRLNVQEDTTLSEPSSPGATEQSRLTSLRRVRERLRKAFPIDSELDGFIIDYYPMVYRRFSSSMDRIAKENLLLSLVEPEELLGTLSAWTTNRIGSE